MFLVDFFFLIALSIIMFLAIATGNSILWIIVAGFFVNWLVGGIVIACFPEKVGDDLIKWIDDAPMGMKQTAYFIAPQFWPLFIYMYFKHYK
jgi:hypothetical protein